MFRARLLAMTLCIAAPLASTGCVDGNDGPTALRGAESSGGPRIIFDLESRPFPEVPFPTDLATTVDPESPTGLRVNVSEVGASEQEERVRRKINRTSGFGLISPISVSFDRPLDLYEIVDRHQEPVPHFEDDAVYLVNVDPNSRGYGELVLLDMGRGNYPVIMKEPDGYYDNDPRAHANNLVFESVREEDLNGNGVLDPIEDTDDDGVFDRPNTLDPGADPNAPGQMLEFYERESNTLIMKPVRPLREGTTYAVVLTSSLRGEDGVPIDSPFPGINHTRQTPDLEPLRTILPRAFPQRFTPDLNKVRFAWSFTTQVATETLQVVRAGLYGYGPLKYLEEDYPPRLELIHTAKEEGAEKPLTTDLTQIIPIVINIVGSQVGPGTAAAIQEAFQSVDYYVSGSFKSPYFLADDDGLADTGVKGASALGNPQDDDESFDIDTATGDARVGEDEVTFNCVVPRETETRKPPFPLIIYSHAISSTRLEILLFGVPMTKFGFATCAIDAVGHGVAIPEEFEALIDNVAGNLEMPNLPGAVRHHRARDLNNDGVFESGGKYFTSDLLHARDNMRQTAIDQMQFIRLLRSWDGERRWPDSVDEDSPYVQARRELVGGWDQDRDGESEIAGDFNADGVVDFGGDRTFVSFGTSLGGIQTAILAGIEPRIKAAVSNAGGGVLGEIALRTDISNVRAGVMLRMMGPLLVGDAVRDEDGEPTGEMRLRWILASSDEDVDVEFGTVSGVEDGDRIILRNPNREKRDVVPEEDRQAEVIVREGKFRVGIAADADGATKRRAKLGFDPTMDVAGDLMGCPEERKCPSAEDPEEEIDCPRNHMCGDEPGTCVPVQTCIEEFDGKPADPDFADELERHTVTDATEFGDPLIIEIRSPSGELKHRIDDFPINTIFENILYPEGTPLAALANGWGLKRQTPQFRRFLGISQMILEVADPAVYATKYFDRPLAFPYEAPAFRDGTTNFLMIGTVGDQTVPISTSIAIARSAGILDTRTYDARWGKTANQFLIDNYVYEGVWWLDRFPEYPGRLFDPDDLSNGAFRIPGNDDPTPIPVAERPLRAEIETETGIQGLRLPYINARGEHTFNAPDPTSAFDIASFETNQVGWYLAHVGEVLLDDPCFEDLQMEGCDFYDFDTFTPSSELTATHGR